MRWQDHQAGIAHVHQRRHHELAFRCLRLIAEGEGGFVAVVAVGNIELGIPEQALRGSDHGRIGNLPDPVQHLIIIQRLNLRLAGRPGQHRPGRLGIQHENMALLRPASPEQCDPVRFGFR